MKDMTKKQAALWVEQELAKVDTHSKAINRVVGIEASMNGFWKSPAGIDAGLKFPNSRQAHIDLYNAVKKVWFA